MTPTATISRSGIAEIRVPAKVSPTFEVKFQPLNERIIRMILREISSKGDSVFVKRVEEALKKTDPKKFIEGGFAKINFCDGDLKMIVLEIDLKKLLGKMKLDDWKRRSGRHLELTKKKLILKKVAKW